MTTVLHLDTSPRDARSISRQLTTELISEWQENYPQDHVIYRDIGHQLIPAVDEPWIAASFSSPDSHTPELAAAIKISDELIDEFLAADRYVFGVPMYNFNVPSNFKAYIDQIVRVRRTFVVNEQGGYDGLVKNKKMLVITARGGSYTQGTPAAQFDFQEPFIRTIFGLIGVTDITFIHADNLAMGDDARAQSLENARREIKDIVNHW